jgi:hypothetical protein
VAKNLTNRVTLTTVTIRGMKNESFVFQTKDAQEQYLYSLAVEHWNRENPLPVTRKGCLEQFYSPKAGNAYNCQTVTLVSNEAASRAVETARKRVMTYTQNRRKETAGRTR